MSEKLASLEQHHTPFETLKESAQTRLHSILYAPLTVENIETFADEALDQTVDLVKELVYEYQTNPNLEGDLSLNPQQQEDAVCEKLGLPNIQDILQRIIEVGKNIESIKQYLEQPKEGSGTVITPPDELEQPLTGEVGNQAFERKKLVPRLLTLIYILQTDFDLDIKNPEEVQMIEGEVTSNMMRKTPYVRVTTPDLQRSIYICDEEGNASYVFDTKKLEELNIPLDDLDIDGKQDKNSLIVMHPSVGVRMIQTPNWRDRMKSCLENELPTQALSAEIDDITKQEETQVSEFEKKEQGGLLPYEEFTKDVKGVWDNIKGDTPTNVVEWYVAEREASHKGFWPTLSKLGKKYKKDGFRSLNDVVAKENKKRRNYVSFDIFCEEVKTAWENSSVEERRGSLEDWYTAQRKNGNVETWPSATSLSRVYVDFKNLNLITGKENPQEKDFVDFDVFKKEVRAAWDAIKGTKPTEINNWYRLERKNGHVKTWPGDRDLTSKYADFIDLHSIIGIENPSKKKYVTFETFKMQVKAAWDSASEEDKKRPLPEWYNTEQRGRHKSAWPSISNAYKIYRESGFNGLRSIIT